MREERQCIACLIVVSRTGEVFCHLLFSVVNVSRRLAELGLDIDQEKRREREGLPCGVGKGWCGWEGRGLVRGEWRVEGRVSIRSVFPTQQTRTSM